MIFKDILFLIFCIAIIGVIVVYLRELKGIRERLDALCKILENFPDETSETGVSTVYTWHLPKTGKDGVVYRLIIPVREDLDLYDIQEMYWTDHGYEQLSIGRASLTEDNLKELLQR